jgi:hypothetical protein
LRMDEILSGSHLLRKPSERPWSSEIHPVITEKSG